jgi:tRNA threonylcarbamoyladenosine biosynthesis protein TsaB
VIVLALDTSTRATVVGLSTPGGEVLEARDDPRPGERPGHSTQLLPLAAAVLEQAGLRWAEIDRVAAGVGPGTFTGLRVGLATAHGLAQASGAELVGVCSLAALAQAAAGAGGGLPVVAAIDARRGEVFVAGYQGEMELFAPAPLTPAAVPAVVAAALGAVPAAVAAAPAAVKAAPAGEAAALGAAPTAVAAAPAGEATRLGGPALALGDGAVLYRAAFEQAGAQVPEDGSALHRIQARALCELGARPPARASVAGPAVLPAYLRQPDAAIALHGALR